MQITYLCEIFVIVMILFTFNLCLPETELAHYISLEEYAKNTSRTTKTLLEVLNLYNTKATFFIEVSLSYYLLETLKQIKHNGHEIALLTTNTTLSELQICKQKLEDFLDKEIIGIRQNDNKFTTKELKPLAFSYINSIESEENYFRLKRGLISTEATEENGIQLIPESISSYLQIPYTDFVFQITPFFLFRNMVLESINKGNTVLLYLQSWQLMENKEMFKNFSFFKKINLGKSMEDKLHHFLKWTVEKELPSSRMKDFLL